MAETPPNPTAIMALAALTPEQRRAWEQMQDEMAAMRAKVERLELAVENLQPGAALNASLPFNVVSRSEFNREVARMLALDDRYGGASSLLYFDFENLPQLAKTVDRATFDTYVNAIIKIFAARVRNCDVVGKLAPTQFGILLVRCDNKAAWTKAEALAVSVQHELATLGLTLKLEVGFGVHTFQGLGDVAEGLRSAAHAVTKRTSA